MLISAYQTTQLHIPVDGNLHRHCQDKLKSCILNSYSPLSLQNQVKNPIQKRKNYYFMYFKLHIFTRKRGRHEVNDVRQTAIQATKPLLPQPEVSEVEMDTEELNI